MFRPLRPPLPELLCSKYTIKSIAIDELSNAQRSTDGRLLSKTFKAEGRVPFTDAAPEDITTAVFLRWPVTPLVCKASFIITLITAEL